MRSLGGPLRRSFCVVFCLAFGLVISPADAASPHGLTYKLLTSNVVLSADGTFVSTVHAEIRADDSATAMSLGQTGLPYNSSYQGAEVLEAYTLKADGTKIPVDVSAVYDQLPPGAAGVPMFTDTHVKEIVFPQVSAGDTVIYTARLTTKRAIFPGQFWYSEIYPKDVAFDEVRET